MNIKFKDNSNYKYFSMIPHIITEIGLRGNEISVYVAIKRSCGEGSTCTKSKAKLAKQAGVCPKTIFTIIQKLCQINPILKKPLIISSERFTKDGDKDTNLIEVVDIWPEATNLFIKIISGEVNFTTPHVKVTRGVRYPLPGGQVKFTDKEEPFKKNPVKNNPPTSSQSEEKGGGVDVKFKKSFTAFLKDCKKYDLPFTAHGIKEAMDVSSPYSVQEMIKEFNKRDAPGRMLKAPDRWLRSYSIKHHEMELIKKDYE